ncbi:endonuclease MutS2 [Enterococcus villorum]|uniref:Endonuclease MutS2 n=2 Tax=Enterococcus villorum TaxID=112904 RepID=A0A511J2Z0_9ENTE|nr:DNA mismatch repair protein MutS2 [Enterococcus villorum]EOH92932.1 DNA mismatch repair protein MutS2 [Enterococcus villorum ATCC 700913]EOW75485.1 DNA mismatch repair protein MutS2 [Enterococcus villorum ATCC 700913]GEL92386.1 endonuclease MutS2 [Enterococcus villorum]
MKQTIDQLQFEQIKKEVQKRAIGQYSKMRIEEMTIQTNLQTVRTRQEETKEARLILDSHQHVPFMGLTRIDTLTAQVKKGLILTPAELIEYADFLRSSRMIRRFFEKNQYQTPLLHAYSKNMLDLLTIEELIYQQIKNQKVSDDASRNLRKVRKQLQQTEKEIQDRLLKFLRHPHNKEMIQESMIVQKGEHYTIPIKASYKNKVPGNIIEQSNKGTTVFIEPVAVEKASMNHQLLKAEEIAEEYQILAFLTGALAEQEQAIDLIIETVTRLDIIFARGKYSREIQGVTPEVNQAEYIKIKQGRHPLLPEDAVPLDFELGNNYRGLVITGANAGGKTVVLKTVGLLTLMAMFGLQVPAAKGTELAVFDEVFVDIGDQQNIENALSTFSGHMQNIAEILRKVKRNTLVLLDEIGSGTEPNEGAALAVAIMETMYEKGALIVATTHYGEIKKFANDHEDFIPAAMAFDREALQPKYLLQVGETGESQALWIAKKMNMSEKLIQQANHYIHDKDYQRKKKEFKVVKAKEPTIKQKKQLFSKGDRVLSTMHQKEALVYEDMGEEMITIYLNKEMIMVPRKRLNLKMSAEQLYPDGYELDQLFTDFQTRKREKDLLRGSKKAHKQLLKEARERKVKKQGEND